MVRFSRTWPPPAQKWWLSKYVDVLKELECDETYELRTPEMEEFRGPLWKFLEQELTVSTAASRWRSGAYLFETVPCVVYILMRHAHDPEEAIARAANGALHGRAGLPARWIDGLSDRTAESDDGLPRR